jgi:hypothetical protein
MNRKNYLLIAKIKTIYKFKNNILFSYLISYLFLIFIEFFFILFTS